MRCPKCGDYSFNVDDGCRNCGYKQPVAESRFQNPLMLTARMFLSEIRSWREQYQEPHYVCTHFAKVVFDAATVRKIRCGYTVVHFQNKMSHAIIAFETDYGLAYFEPQTGDQEYLVIGQPYRTQLEGVPSGSQIEKIDIEWNDQMNLRFVSCSDCGYLLPVSCPICGSGHVDFTK